MRTIDLINQYISKNGITYEVIAEKTAMPKERVMEILNGEQKMYAEEYFLICKALGVDLMEFWDI